MRALSALVLVFGLMNQTLAQQAFTMCPCTAYDTTSCPTYCLNTNNACTNPAPPTPTPVAACSTFATNALCPVGTCYWAGTGTTAACAPYTATTGCANVTPLTTAAQSCSSWGCNAPSGTATVCSALATTCTGVVTASCPSTLVVNTSNKTGYTSCATSSTGACIPVTACSYTTQPDCTKYGGVACSWNGTTCSATTCASYTTSPTCQADVACSWSTSCSLKKCSSYPTSAVCTGTSNAYYCAWNGSSCNSCEPQSSNLLHVASVLILIISMIL